MGKTLQTTIEIAGSLNASFESAISNAQGGIESLEAAAENSGLDKLSGGLDSVAAASGAAGDGFTVFKGILSNLAADGIELAASALKDFAGDTVKTGMEFSGMMSEVQALSGASSGEIEKLEATAREYGASTVFSATEAAEALKYMALAGWDTEQSASALGGVLDLAAASGMGLGAASDMVTDYLSAFSMEADQASYFADMLTVAQSTSNTTTEALGEAYKNCAANLNAAGQDVETVTSLLMVMANQGEKGSEAGTKLKAVMRDISNSMEDGAIAIGDTNVAVTDSNGNFRDLTDILTDVEEATQGLGDAERTTALQTSFTSDSLSAVNEILNAGVGSAEAYEEALRDSAGSASEAARTMTDNLSGDVTTFNSAVSELGLTIYDYVDGPLRGVVQGATDIINGISGALSPQKTLMDEFISDIDAINEEARTSLENAQATIDNADIDAGKLDYYKGILLDLNDETERTQWQNYQLKDAVSKLSTYVPELAAAWDEQTKSLSLTNDEIADLINNQKKIVQQRALIDASEDALAAQASAALAKSMSDSAVEELEAEISRLETLNDQSLMEDSQAGWGYGAYYKELNDAQADLDKAEKEQKKANETYEESSKNAEDMALALEKSQEMLGITAESADDLSNSVDGATDSLGGIEDGADEATEAADEVKKAFEEMRESIVTSAQGAVSAFDTFSGGTEISAGDVLANLQSQQEGLRQWTENMTTLAGAAGEGMTQELYDYLAGLGTDGANLVQTLVDSMGSNPEQFSQIASTYADNLKLADESGIIATYTSVGTGIAETVGETSEGMANTLETGVASGADAAANSMVSAFGDAMGTIYSDVSNELSNLQALFSSTKFSFNQSIALPHFSMSGSFDAKTQAVPSVSVSWHKEGGILTGATIFGELDGVLQGAGEAGAEAVLPLDLLWKNMGSLLDTALAGQNSQSAAAGKLLSLEDFSLSELAAGSQSIVYDFSGMTYAPIVNVTGSGDADDIIEKLKQNESDFFDWLESWVKAKGAAMYA